jgi:sporulation protein YlmC with PRC-barrel domain
MWRSVAVFKQSSFKCLALVIVMGVTGFVHTARAQVSSKEAGNLEQTHENWRASNLNGTTVYNDKGDGVATINDLLIDSHGRVANVVLSVGSFLGMSAKYVEIPFSALKFKSTRPGPSGPETPDLKTVGNKVDYSAVLPGATKDTLKAMPNFVYNK